MYWRLTRKRSGTGVVKVSGSSTNDKLLLSKAGERLVFAGLVNELTDIYPKRCKDVVAYWERKSDMTRTLREFGNSEDYLEYKLVDCCSACVFCSCLLLRAVRICPSLQLSDRREGLRHGTLNFGGGKRGL